MKTKENAERNTFNVVCYLKKNVTLKNGLSPLYLRITINKEKVSLNISGSVNPSMWNAEKEKSTDKKDKRLNLDIESMKSRLNQIYRELQIECKPISPQIVKDVYLGKKETGKTLIEVYTEHNDRCKKLENIDYSCSTIYKFDTSLRYLKEFMSKELNIEDIPLNDLNEDFIRKYELFIKTEKHCNNNSSINYLKIMKKIILYSLGNNWMQINPFNNIKLRKDEVHPEFLTMAELEIIIHKEITIKRLDRIRDVFVFCCFTGLAFGDVRTLLQEHIIQNPQNEYWIRKTRIKNGNMCNIPLLSVPGKIISKYQQKEKNDKNLLPVPTNQKMNAYLKETADV